MIVSICVSAIFFWLWSSVTSIYCWFHVGKLKPCQGWGLHHPGGRGTEPLLPQQCHWVRPLLVLSGEWGNGMTVYRSFPYFPTPFNGIYHEISRFLLLKAVLNVVLVSIPLGMMIPTRRILFKQKLLRLKIKNCSLVGALLYRDKLWGYPAFVVFRMTFLVQWDRSMLFAAQKWNLNPVIITKQELEFADNEIKCSQVSNHANNWLSLSLGRRMYHAHAGTR